MVAKAGLEAYAGRRVFVTGHTGFKGSWLCVLLSRLGATVHGYALAPAAGPGHFTLAGIGDTLATHTVGDIRDAAALAAALRAAQPEIVLHLAAQPLVRESYRDPVQTWSSNVMGTVHLLEAVRACASVRAAVVVTTDKCYENREWLWGYRESDPLGGHDPYSASKAGTELVVGSYRKSFLATSGKLIASARAGNVIGGGDWSPDRLIPDAVRAIASGKSLEIRHPAATRPWQHVLESLHGYLLLGARLLAGDTGCADAFNFGPAAADNQPVASVLARLQSAWPDLHWQHEPSPDAPHEAGYLYLDSSKATRLLGWHPRWGLDRALTETAYWYREVSDRPERARAVTDAQVDAFLG